MASRIQGITVEIGGDTTKLSSALSGINKEIKGTQTQLKDVEKLLKLDPSNTELVAQKQKLLAQEIGATKEKLTTLKTAAEQANEQLQKGEITQEQYDALQREIQETEQKLNPGGDHELHPCQNRRNRRQDADRGRFHFRCRQKTHAAFRSSYRHWDGGSKDHS